MNTLAMKKTKKLLFYVVLCVIIIAYLMPLGLVILNSFKTYAEIMTDVLSLPEKWSFDNFQTVFQDMNYPVAFRNTLVVTVVGTLGIVILGAMGGYKMARVKTKYSKIIFFLAITPMMIPFQSFMITLVKIAVMLHINQSILGLSVIYWGLGTPMAIFLYHGFSKGIPRELEESALIDGANQFVLFTRIIFPLLKATTASVIVVNAMWLWNDFLLPLLMLGAGRKNKTLQLAAYAFMGQYKLEWNKIMAAAILIIIPALVIYLIFQKHIIKGMVSGAVKG